VDIRNNEKRIAFFVLPPEALLVKTQTGNWKRACNKRRGPFNTYRLNPEWGNRQETADLLKRLRASEPVGPPNAQLHVLVNPDGAEAADEIERLRKALYHTDVGCAYTHLYDESEYTKKEPDQ
jgi:hypothetical protein